MGDIAVTKPELWFSMMKILGERDFYYPSDQNIDPTFSLQSIVKRFAETELLNSGFHDLEGLADEVCTVSLFAVLYNLELLFNSISMTDIASPCEMSL